ncbi:MAG: undecaprenyl-phosphate glucose phosphotransferase [Betaproteobacteria bacterium TMED156]|nr:MAG: undecaprenyl-phosphate glucose phosphotransferase [Betaproteobacteria bacterium TMED156]
MTNQNSRFLAREHSGLIEISSRIIDISSILLAALLVTHFTETHFINIQNWTLLVFVKILLCLIIFKESQLYRSWRGRPFSDQFSRLIISFILSSSIMLLFWSALNLKVIIRLDQFLVWLAISGAMIFTLRAIAYTFVRELRKKGINQKKVIIYGAGDLGKSLLNRSISSPESGFLVTGFIDDGKSQSTTIHNKPVIGGIDQLPLIIETNPIDEIWLALPLKAIDQIERITEITSKKNVSIRLIPDLFGLTLLNHSVTEFLGFPVIDLSVNRMVGINSFIKSCEDRILGLLIFLVTIPFLIFVSTLLLLTSGTPIIFKQKRMGWDGKSFTIYKFRTMKPHCEYDNKITQARKNDERFTMIGKWLRKTSFDELPQIINVLQGRMSLVGPRPHVAQHENEFQSKIQGYVRRHRVKPGITGWAQVNDLRGEIKSLEDINRRLQHDLFYIENWSLLFDLRIILTTIIKIFFSRQAW